MIRNVVFDFGQVMVRFEPDYMVGVYVSDEADRRLLSEVIFDRLYWNALDSGNISDAEVVLRFKERIPERLHSVAEKIYYNWIYNIPEISGMSELVERIKREYGVRVFLLSNICTYFAENEEKLPILSLFEKRIYSAVCGFVKPDAKIFEHLCLECDILPQDTLFIDDSPKNIKGAESFGIKGYLFDGDAKRLSDYLDSVLS